MTDGLFSRLAALPKLVKAALGLVIALVLLALIVPAVLMGNPRFVSGFGEMKDNYDTLQTSKHAGLSCRDCHADSRGALAGAVGSTIDFYGLILGNDGAVVMDAPPRAACVTCHEHDWSHDPEVTSRLPHPAHLRVSSEQRDCVSCHKWTGHQEDYIPAHGPDGFVSLCASYDCHVGYAAKDTCQNCHHALWEGAGVWLANHPGVVFESGDAGCYGTCHAAAQCQACHTTGESPFVGGLGPSETAEIEAMHARSDWARRHGASALRDELVCRRCHVSTRECDSCHARRPASHDPQQTWIALHKDAVKVEGQCLTCHKQTWCDDCHSQFKESR